MQDAEQGSMIACSNTADIIKLIDSIDKKDKIFEMITLLGK